MLNGGIGIGIVLRAKDEMSAVMQRAEHRFKQFERATDSLKNTFKKNFAQLGAGVTSLAVGTGALAGAFALAGKAGQFEQALGGLRVIAGATAEEMRALRDAALQVGMTTKFDPTEAAVALREIAALGYTAKDSMDLLNPSLTLASASLGELSASAAAGTLTKALKAFGHTTADAAADVDKLMMAANAFALSPGELPSAIAHVVKGAQSLQASLDETLISVGLAKNILGSVELASTGVAVAMERIVKGKTQEALKEIGVSATDSSGRFRDFLTILTDVTNSPIFKGMSQAGQAGFINETFGHHALGAISSIMVQLRTGVKDASGQLVQGAAAVDMLRKRFQGAAGSANEFKDALLNTFEGQKQLIGSKFKTLQIVLGEAFARAFRPVVETVSKALDFIVSAIRKIPEPVKDVIAKIVLVAGAIAAAFGAFVTLKAGIVLGVAALKLLGITAAGVLVTLGPIALAFGALGAAAYFFRDKIFLFFKGLGQLLGDGGFSGDVMESLSRAENSGVKAFAIKVFLWFNRIKEFFKGVSEGFQAGLTRWKPVFDTFVRAVEQLGAAFGFSVGSANENGKAFDAMGATGSKVGETLVAVAGIITTVLGGAIELATHLVNLWKFEWQAFGPVVMNVVDIIRGAGEILSGLFTGSWSDIFNGLVRIVGGAMAAVANAVLGALKLVAGAIDSIAGLAGWDTGLAKSLNGLEVNASNFVAADPVRSQRAAETARFDAAESQIRANPAMAAIAGSVRGSVPDSIAANPGNITVPVVLNLEGRKVAAAIAELKRDEVVRGYRMAPTIEE